LFSWKNTSEEQLFKNNQLSSNEAFLNMSTSAAEREGDADVWPVMSSHDLETGADYVDPLPPYAITVFVVLLVLSGAFSSTFTLVFAYISDTVRHRDERVAAYGLALATFGLSFTIGPMAGGYLAESNKHDVFMCSFLLTCLAVLYIYFILPESTSTKGRTIASSAASIISLEHNISWSPRETMRIMTMDPFLRRVGQVAFLYYTGLWALISTMSLYAVQRFHLTPQRLGELMSTLGLCTMLAEAVLLRILVPLLGEKSTARLGLLSFALQCILLGFAYEGWHLFVCALFSMFGNLVYPSLSSLVSDSVEPDAVGEALGALNGVKALTEGIGPLVFGSLMTLSENSALPGWPYLVASLLVFAAYQLADGLPDDHSDDYIHELEFKKTTLKRSNLFQSTPTFPAPPTRGGHAEEEYQALLSEIDEEDDSEEDGVRVNFSIGATC
jgi:MFS transporter, DHA1 family, tetracycline resistance protein